MLFYIILILMLEKGVSLSSKKLFKKVICLLRLFILVELCVLCISGFKDFNRPRILLVDRNRSDPGVPGDVFQSVSDRASMTDLSAFGNIFTATQTIIHFIQHKSPLLR